MYVCMYVWTQTSQLIEVDKGEVFSFPDQIAERDASSSAAAAEPKSTQASAAAEGRGGKEQVRRRVCVVIEVCM